MDGCGVAQACVGCERFEGACMSYRMRIKSTGRYAYMQEVRQGKQKNEGEREMSD